MKRIFILLFLLTSFIGLNAQNIQLHYDLGSALYNNDLKDRPVVTTTVEMFKPDSWGSTYFFVDMDYTSKGIASAYWEIARELKFWQPPFSIHVEYNGGLNNMASFQNAYLGGLTYTYNNSSFTKGFSLSAMYKYIQKLEEAMTEDVTIPCPYKLVRQDSGGVRTIQNDETGEKHAVMAFTFLVSYGYKVKI